MGFLHSMLAQAATPGPRRPRASQGHLMPKNPMSILGDPWTWSDIAPPWKQAGRHGIASCYVTPVAHPFFNISLVSFLVNSSVFAREGSPSSLCAISWPVYHLSLSLLAPEGLPGAASSSSPNMPTKAEDTARYRRDDRAGGKLMTAQERLKLIEVSSNSRRSTGWTAGVSTHADVTRSRRADTLSRVRAHTRTYSRISPRGPRTLLMQGAKLGARRSSVFAASLPTSCTSSSTS